MNYTRLTAFLPVVFFFAVRLSGQQAPQLIIPRGHSGPTSAVFTPDGKELFTYGKDFKQGIWDVASARISGYLNYDKYISKAFFLGDKKTLVTVSDSAAITYWNWQQKKIISTAGVPGHLSAAYINDEASVLSLVYSTGVIINWDLNLKSRISTMMPDTKNKPIGTVALSSDGSFLAVSFYPSYEVIILDVKKGHRVKSIKLENEVAENLSFLPGNILSVFDENAARLYKGPFFDSLKSIDVYGATWVAAYKNERLITGVNWKSMKALSGELTVIDIKSGEMLHTLNHKNRVIDFKIIDSSSLISVSNDGHIHFWNYRTGEYEDILEESFTGTFKEITMSTDKRLAAVTSDDIFNTFTLHIIDTRSHQLLSSFTKSANAVSDALPSPDSHSILFAEKTALKNWNTGSIALSHIGNTEELVHYSKQQIIQNYYKYTALREFSMLPELDLIFANWDSNWVFTKKRTYDDTVKLWSLKSFKKIKSFGYDKLISTFRPDPQGKYLFLAFEDSTFCITSIGNTSGEVKFHSINREITAGKVSPDGSFVMLVTEDTLVKYDLLKQERLGSYYINSQEDEFYILSSSCKWLLRDNGQVIELETGKLLFTVPDLAGDRWKRFNNNDETVVYQSTKGNINIYDVSQKKVTHIIKGVRGTIQSLSINQHSNRALAAMDDRTVKVFDLVNGKEIASFIFFGEGDFVIHVPAGYYMSTPGAAKLLHYVQNGRITGFEQLDLKYNRPDKIIEILGGADSTLIKSYEKAWQKRMRKLGLDTSAFRDGYSVPEADIVNGKHIDYKQKNSELKIQIKGADKVYKINRFNVWVNEVPVFGQRGARLPLHNKNFVDTTVIIKLSEGANRIEASITNVNGTESYRMPLYVNYTPAVKQKETLRFIGIGIDQFKDSKHNLQYSSKDIRDLSVKLKEKYKDDIIIDTLFNENVTISNVKALKQKLEQTSVNDKVIISYSGHGLLSKDYDYFLSTYSINFDKPEENGLPYEELENLLDSIPARKKLMLIDACHSGEVDKDEMTRITSAADSLSQHGTKGGIPTYTGKTTLGMKNSFELMQSLFVNVGKSTGATIISAAAGTQFALERGDLKNGVFTYCILEAMDKYPTMKISELKKIVGERVEQLTNGLQKPTSRNETIAVDWSLW